MDERQQLAAAQDAVALGVDTWHDRQVLNRRSVDIISAEGPAVHGLIDDLFEALSEPVKEVTMTAITKTNIMTGEEITVEIPVDPVKYNKWIGTRRDIRPRVQDHFPELNADQREFLISGIPPGDWDKWVPDPDAEEVR